MVVTWPLAAVGYVSEMRTNLTTADSWAVVTNVPAIAGFQFAVTNRISGDRRFYRLRK